MPPRILALAIAALILTACTSTGGREFVSDRISVVTRGTGPHIILIPGLTGHRDQRRDRFLHERRRQLVEVPPADATPIGARGHLHRQEAFPFVALGTTRPLRRTGIKHRRSQRPAAQSHLFANMPRNALRSSERALKIVNSEKKTSVVKAVVCA